MMNGEGGGRIVSPELKMAPASYCSVPIVMVLVPSPFLFQVPPVVVVVTAVLSAVVRIPAWTRSVPRKLGDLPVASVTVFPEAFTVREPRSCFTVLLSVMIAVLSTVIRPVPLVHVLPFARVKSPERVNAGLLVAQVIVPVVNVAVHERVPVMVMVLAPQMMLLVV